jgi:hypothetical protein
MAEEGPSIEGYWAQVRALGLRERRQINERQMLCEDKDGHFQTVRISYEMDASLPSPASA